jgi:hypothetical protein
VAFVVALAAPVSAEPDCSVHGACCFPRATPAMRMPRRPLPVHVTVATDGSGLPTDIVRRYVRRAATELAACAPRDLELALVIDPRGAVVAAAHKPSVAGRCAAGVLRAIRFPYDARDAATQATIRIQLVE